MKSGIAEKSSIKDSNKHGVKIQNPGHLSENDFHNVKVLTSKQVVRVL
jgi:hypothetical protein